MTIEANGQSLTVGNLYRTANKRSLPRWQRGIGVIFMRLLEEGIEGFDGDVAVVQQFGTQSQFLIPTALLSKVA